MAEVRKLAAIPAADVVGFSRLTGADEDRTLARLRALRSDLIDPTISVHNGRVVKRTGDGAIVEFRSVVDAVRCAIEIQNGMIERNAGLPRRSSHRLPHRHSSGRRGRGEPTATSWATASTSPRVLKASPSLAAICLSEDAYRQVKARLGLAVIDLGPTHLKNIAEPVRAYSVQVGRPRRRRRSRRKSQARRPSPSPCLTGPRSRFSPSRRWAATPSRSISPTAWSRTSSPASRASNGCS